VPIGTEGARKTWRNHKKAPHGKFTAKVQIGDAIWDW